MNIVAVMNSEGIIGAAVDRLQSLGFTVAVRTNRSTSDSDVVLDLQRGDVSLRVEGDVRRHLRRETVGAVAVRHRAAGAARLLIAELVTPAVAEDLRRAGVQFVDTGGNAYLDAPGLFVWVSGKTAGKARLSVGIGRPAPTRVLFALLVQPTLLNAPLRQLAEAGGVSLGAAQAAVKALLLRGEIVEVRARRRFADAAALAERWPEMYVDHLRPHLELGRFRTRQDLWWSQLDLRPYNAAWSGEVAASRMGTLLRPATVTIFAENLPGELVIASRLAADIAGTVRFYRKFWRCPADPDRPDLAPALLVYADLLANGDSRSLEAAKEVFDTHVLRPLRAI